MDPRVTGWGGSSGVEGAEYVGEGAGAGAAAGAPLPRPRPRRLRGGGVAGLDILDCQFSSYSSMVGTVSAISARTND